MRTYGQYCPVAAAAEMLGDRWTLLIVRDLITGAHRFNEIERGMHGISRTILSDRLRLLERYGLIERRRVGAGHHEYWLTPIGADLEPAVLSLGNWAARHFGKEPSPRELDASRLMLWIERFARRAELPPGRWVARFEFTGPRRERRWLLVEDGNPTACETDPGPEPALVVRTDLNTLHQVFGGRLALRAALRDGSLEIEGRKESLRTFPRWFGLSPFADAMKDSVRATA